MAQTNPSVSEYNDDSIRTLEDVVHIRKRPGMYIGRLGDGSNQGDGIYVLLKEVVDNCIDEFAMGFGKNVKIDIDDAGKVTVRDFGRGIPLGKLTLAVSKLNTGAKYDTKVFQKSVGLNGVGTKAVNALSSYFHIEAYRNGKTASATFKRGRLQEEVTDKDNVSTKEKNGTPYMSKNGLLDIVNDNLSEEPLYPPIHLEGEDIEVVLTHGNAYGENIASFVNGQNTRDGGTHLAAFREAIAKTLKEFFKKDYAPEDIRQGVIGAISIRIQEPNFEGQTKTKLGSTYTYEQEVLDENGNPVKDANGANRIERGPTIRAFINDFIKTNLDNYLHIHKDIVPVIQAKIIASETERKEISGIQKKTRERNKRTNIYNRKLRDCKLHLGDRITEQNKEKIDLTSIFITEGDSASGTITKARDAQTQAVFSLRGKPINCYKESRKKVAENEELNLLLNALGVEDDVADLRYNRIVVATDADDDGMHIRMLVLTFFMKYYPELIRNGHVYILQTPLFRVRNKKEAIYCYDAVEKEKAIRKLKTGVEITRFKGLGEISSDEFKDFIGDGMRLDPVTLSDEESISEIMEFYMGDNTIERQNFIRGNLRSEEELEDVNI